MQIWSHIDSGESEQNRRVREASREMLGLLRMRAQCNACTPSAEHQFTSTKLVYSSPQRYEVHISVIIPTTDGETEAGEIKSLKLSSRWSIHTSSRTHYTKLPLFLQPKIICDNSACGEGGVAELLL